MGIVTVLLKKDHRPSTVNERWTKRDTTTGKFIDQKADKTQFKGVRKEK